MASISICTTSHTETLCFAYLMACLFLFYNLLGNASCLGPLIATFHLKEGKYACASGERAKLHVGLVPNISVSICSKC
ncbi:hypothetical protein GGI35DRAFT_204876 [Trichoderma velutinum]